MLVLSGIHETVYCTYFSWQFVIHLSLILLLCNFGKAGIIVYDGIIDVDEFPDIELPYTKPIRRSGLEGILVAANPLHACVNVSRPPHINESSVNWFVLMSGNSCNFETKVLNAKLAGYSLGIIYTYRGRVETPNNHGLNGHFRFHSEMPAIVVKLEHGIKMKDNYLFNNVLRYRLVVFPNNAFSIMTFLLLFSIVAGLFLVIMLAFTVIRFFQQSDSPPNGRLTSQHLKQLQTTTFQKGNLYETCAICLEDYKDQEKLRILPCSHAYHMKCIDPWLTNNRRSCPVCKRKITVAGERRSNTRGQNFVERTESTPLLQAGRADPHGTFSCLNIPAAVNQSNSSVGNVASSVPPMSSASVPTERQHDRQCVYSFLQL